MVRRTFLVLLLAFGCWVPAAGALPPCTDAPGDSARLPAGLPQPLGQPPDEPPPGQEPPEPVPTETVPVPVPPGTPGAPEASPRTGADLLPLFVGGSLFLGLGAWLRRSARRRPGLA